jgi:hypothetical protein
MTSSPENEAGLLDANSAATVVPATTEMAPDCMMRYIEDANRLVEVDVKEDIGRPIRQRRATIAPVMDTVRINPIAHPDIMREVVSEPSFGSVDTAEAA